LDVRKPLSRVAGILGLAMLCGLLRAAAGAPDAIAAPGIEVRACAAAAGIVCAVLADSAGARREVKFAVAPFTPVDAGAMGAFDIGGSRHLLAYVYGAGKGGDARVLVIDETAGRKLAEAAAPAGYGAETVWFAYIRDPAGRRRPFIAPGAHYLTPHRNPTGAYQASEWNYLCLFNPAALARPDATCGTGFTAYSTHFATPQGPDAAISGFRHGGGWVEDVDGDGWDDINLPFLQYILTLSGRTGRPLALAHFDVAAQSEPRSPPYFHSGRFYGRFAAFTEPATGRHDVLFTDGEAAGYFGGLYCGVSRFVAVAQWRPGPRLVLKWADYLSFAKTIFKPPYASTADVARRGDDLNRCPHFAGTGLAWLAGRPLVLFSLFTEDHPSPACQPQLLAEQKSNFAKDVSAAYEFHCAPKDVPAAVGKWSVHILDALNGKEFAVLPNLYLWGEAPNVIPGKAGVLLVQRFLANGGDVAYNRSAAAADALSLLRLAPGPALRPLATIEGPLAVPATAGTTYSAPYGFNGGGPAYPPGIGSSYGGVSRLVLAGGRRRAIKLADGKWLGYSAGSSRLAVSLAPPP
jgi:hypothetical protein